MAETALRWQPSWSDIPPELAGLVLRRLPSHVDRVRFAAVCPQWRAAARQGPLPPPLPLLALRDGTVYSLPFAEPFRFSACANYTDACGNWLIFSRQDGCFLKDPFSTATVTLPALSRVRVGRGRSQDVKDLTVHKLMVCSPQIVAAMVWFEESTQIAVCQPGAASWWSTASWLPERVEEWFPQFVDIAFHKGKLYALDCRDCSLFSVDISMDQGTGDPWISRARRVINGVPGPGHIFMGGNIIVRTMYLVESRGALLMVVRKMYGVWKSAPHRGELVAVDADGRNEFEVFQADFKRSRWTKTTTLGDDQVLFLRRRCCRSVCVSQEEMPGDCIIFLENDDEDRHWYDEESSSSCSVYSMKYGSVSTLLPSWERGNVLATWLFPQN